MIMNQSSLKLQQSTAAKITRIKLSGHIDEDANYTTLKINDMDEIHFDFEGITLINSTGIQKWIKFLREVPATTRVFFEKCPIKLVHQLNLFPGFTADKSVSITSFFAPYFCDCNEKSHDILLTTKIHFASGKEFSPPVINCPTCKQAMEFDAIEKKYFLFLKRKN